MLKDKIYDRKIVKKPWGYEYVALRNKDKLAITFLNINYKKKNISSLSSFQKNWIYFVKR